MMTNSKSVRVCAATLRMVLARPAALLRLIVMMVKFIRPALELEIDECLCFPSQAENQQEENEIDGKLDPMLLDG